MFIIQTYKIKDKSEACPLPDSTSKCWIEKRQKKDYKIILEIICCQFKDTIVETKDLLTNHIWEDKMSLINQA